jgi:uncharacterized protein YndB with AHSA1/START domain
METKSSKTAGKPALTIERVFDAPVEMVWKAWTDPETIKKWWGPENFTAPEARIDFKVGGKYLLCMSGPMPDGSTMKSWSAGTYKEIVPMKRIVVSDSFSDERGNVVPASHYGLPESFPMESKIIFSFEDLGGRTKMTLHYPSIEGIEGEMLKNMTMGWNQSLDKLARALV